MKKIEAYQTSDGKIFDRREAAQANEALYQFLKAVVGSEFTKTDGFFDDWDTPSIFRLLQEHFPTAIEAIIETAEEDARELAEEVEFDLGNESLSSFL